MSPKGEHLYSYALLTVNAEQHPLMNKFHKPGEEKRMVVILPLEHFGACLQAKPEKSRDFLRPYPANLLKATEASSPQQDIFGR